MEAFPFPLSSGKEDALVEANLPQSQEDGILQCVVKRAGPLLLGPKMSTSPVSCLINCLARRNGTDEFYTAKILSLSKPGEESKDDIQGKILVHTEYTLLKSLRDMSGVIRQYGMYMDKADDEVEIGGKGYLNGETQRRIIFLLECYNPHDYSPEYANQANLQHFVIREKRLSESLTVKIFYNVMKVVRNLHSRNIVHRDLKLGNILVKKDSWDIKLTNFGLGKQLIDENEELRDQRGSPAYISPEVLSGKGFRGKPSDMWAMGVVLYTMLYGQFPFYEALPAALFAKIKLGHYQIPTEYGVSLGTVQLIQSLLLLNPMKRPTAAQAVKKLEEILNTEKFLQDSDLQAVPSLGPVYADDYIPRSKHSDSGVCCKNCGSVEGIVQEITTPPDALLRFKRPTQEAVKGDQQPPSKVAKMMQEEPVAQVTDAKLLEPVPERDLVKAQLQAKARAMAAAYAQRMREVAAKRYNPAVVARRQRNQRLNARVAKTIANQEFKSRARAKPHLVR